VEEVWDPASLAKKIHIPTYDEILERIKRRYPRRRRDPIETEIARLQTVYNIATSKTDGVVRLYRLLKKLHPFFWDLITIEINREVIEDSMRCILRARELASRFWEKYRYLLLGSESPRELRRISMETTYSKLVVYGKCKALLWEDHLLISHFTMNQEIE